MRIGCVVVDDEPLARLRLRDWIGEVPWLAWLGEAADGPSAVRAIDALRPDIVFLDIELPGLSGISVLEQVRHRSAVIFTTAFDCYAVTAFELMALDYLLKPFGRARFEAAVERARQGLDLAERSPSLERVRQALGASGPASRLFLRERGKIVGVAVAEIERIESQDDYVLIHAGGRRHLVHVTLTDIERRLEAGRFVRVHRSHLVNLDHVAELLRGEDGRVELLMRDGARLTASRARSRELRQLAL